MPFQIFDISTQYPKFQFKPLVDLLTEFRSLGLNICSAAEAEDRNLVLNVQLSFGPKAEIGGEVGRESIWLSAFWAQRFLFIGCGLGAKLYCADPNKRAQS